MRKQRSTIHSELRLSPGARLVDAIRVRAYYLYEQHGRRSGHELDDWLAAGNEIKARKRRTVAV